MLGLLVSLWFLAKFRIILDKPKMIQSYVSAFWYSRNFRKLYKGMKNFFSSLDEPKIGLDIYIN